MNYPTLAHFRHFSLFRHSTIITYFQKRSILTNKANFEDGQMIANLITIKVYEENGHSGHQKTNPIQTQLKPKQTQFNPIQTQFKANQSQFFKKPFSSMLIFAILPSLKNMHFPDKVSIKNSRKQRNNSLKLSEKGRKITKMPYKSNLVRR